MNVGDKIKIKSGRQVWTILDIFKSNGYDILHLVNPQGNRHTNCYIDDAKLVESDNA